MEKPSRTNENAENRSTQQSGKTRFMKTQLVCMILRIRYNENTRLLANYAIRADSYRAKNILPRTICRNDTWQAKTQTVYRWKRFVRSLQVRSYVFFGFICVCKRNRPLGRRCLMFTHVLPKRRSSRSAPLVNMKKTRLDIKAIDLCLCYLQQKCRFSIYPSSESCGWISKTTYVCTFRDWTYEICHKNVL